MLMLRLPAGPCRVDRSAACGGSCRAARCADEPGGRTPTGRSAAAQATPDKALPTARSIIDRHIAAIGGRAAILARTSTHATGTVAIPSAGHDRHGGRLRREAGQDAAADHPRRDRVIEEGFDGKVGWSLSPMTGPAWCRARNWSRSASSPTSCPTCTPTARYESMTTVEKAEFDGRPCYKVRLVRAGGGEEIEFYDVTTGLKAGGITTRESPMGPIPATTIESDYRQFGPLLQPATIKSTAMGLEQVFTVTTMRVRHGRPGDFRGAGANQGPVEVIRGASGRLLRSGWLRRCRQRRRAGRPWRHSTRRGRSFATRTSIRG